MASKHAGFSGADVHPLDIMGPTMASLRHTTQDRLLSSTHILSATWEHGQYAHLYHCKGGHTFLKGKCSHLGLADEEIECHELSSKNIRQAFANMSYLNPLIAVVTADGELLTCGDPSYGALGRPVSRGAPGLAFGRVTLDGVQHIAVGGYHCLAITSDEEKVYGFGYNVRHQLDKTGSDFTAPREIYSGKGGAAPYQVACGRLHSVILTKDGTVLTCGDGRYGQGCQGSTCGCQDLKQVSTLEGKHVVQIGCTEYVTYLLADGILYVSGSNDDGSAGIGHKENVLAPSPIDFGGRKVDSFRCNRNMVVVRCTSGETFYFGLCEDGIIMKPRQVTECKYGRHVFQEDKYPGTGGLVYMVTGTNSLVIDELTPEKQALVKQVYELCLQNDTLAGELLATQAAMKSRDEQVQELQRKLQESQTIKSLQTAVDPQDEQMQELQRELQESKKAIKSLQAYVELMTSTGQDTAASTVHVMLPPEEGHILVKNHMFLLGNLSADEMKHHLYQRGIITEHQMEVIEASPTSKEKNEKLLKFIKRHKDGYKALMEILDHPDFRTTGIADKLRATDISQIRDIRK